jgi:hypothetical protein
MFMIQATGVSSMATPLAAEIFFAQILFLLTSASFRGQVRTAIFTRRLSILKVKNFILMKLLLAE